MADEVVLTGVKPTGRLHLGNYLGMIEPLRELAREFSSSRRHLFIANYHALNTISSAEELRSLTHEVACSLLAFDFVDRDFIFYRQSDIPEIFELTTVLSAVTPKGLMDRGHAYKAIVDQNARAGAGDVDAGVNMGLYTYPLLMTADILLFDTTYVPVGQDQKQHIEFARDIAGYFNRTFGETFPLPKPSIGAETAIVPGTDGRKMSKSYNNTIPLFGTASELDDAVKKIVTDSRPPSEPKDPGSVTLFRLYRLFAEKADVASMAHDFEKGLLGYGEAKRKLRTLLDRRFGPVRERFDQLMHDPTRVEAILQDGAKRARAIAVEKMREVRHRIGATR